MAYGALTIGVATVVVCLVAFPSVLPRGGQVSPLVRSDSAQSAFMMIWTTLLLVGAALALFGFPDTSATGLAR